MQTDNDYTKKSYTEDKYSKRLTTKGNYKYRYHLAET